MKVFGDEKNHGNNGIVVPQSKHSSTTVCDRPLPVTATRLFNSFATFLFFVFTTVNILAGIEDRALPVRSHPAA